MSKIRRSTLVLILLFAGALGTATAWKTPPPVRFAGIQESELPEQIGGYTAQGEALSVDQSTRDALGTADIASHTYVSAADTASTPIEFVLISGTDREALHDPRSCLNVAGRRIENDHSEILPETGGVPVHVCRIVADNAPDGAAAEMMYLYVVDGKVIESITQIRARMAASALLGRKNTPIYFVRFIRPVVGSEEANRQEHEKLIQFAAAMWQRLHLVRR